MTCKCDPKSWFVTPPPVCTNYQPGVEGICDNCEHDKACHEVEDEH